MPYYQGFTYYELGSRLACLQATFGAADEPTNVDGRSAHVA